MKAYEILMGACGWEHEQWQTQYYPEDLPPDWRLAYYGNEFPVVLIPEGYWRADRATITQWLEESEERPLFIAQMPTELTLQSLDLTMAQWLEKLSALKERLVGINCPIDKHTSVEKLLAPLPNDVPVCLEPTDAETQEDWASILDKAPREAGWCWHGQGDAACMQRGPITLARIDSQAITPRELRTVVEACLAASDAQRSVALIADGEPPDLETLRNAEVILNLI